MTKAFTRSSLDPISGTDKKATTLWQEIWETYIVFVNNYNEIRSKKDPETFKPLGTRTLDSVKKQWNLKIQPALNKFSSLCASNPPDSGETKNDSEMKLYYVKMHRMYGERACANKKLPKSIHPYF